MSGWECPRCGETRSATTRCGCSAADRCPWCRQLYQGYPRCECAPPEDDDWADREERKREREAQYAKEEAEETPAEHARDWA
jgi:hypothetical protein